MLAFLEVQANSASGRQNLCDEKKWGGGKEGFEYQSMNSQLLIP